MKKRERQQYWTREAIESMKAPIRGKAFVPVSKLALSQTEVLDGGCLLYRLRVRAGGEA
jgi:hypothetical protein